MWATQNDPLNIQNYLDSEDDCGEKAEKGILAPLHQRSKSNVIKNKT